MRRQKVNLILNIIILWCWTVVGINRAVTEPSWLCLLDGGIMMAYLLMTIDGIFNLARTVENKKQPQFKNYRQRFQTAKNKPRGGSYEQRQTRKIDCRKSKNR